MKRILGWLALPVILMLAGCNVFSPFSKPGNSTDEVSLLDDAYSAIKAGNYQQAFDYYDQTLRLYPNSAMAAMGRCRCRFLLRLTFSDMADLGGRLQGKDKDTDEPLAQGVPLIDPAIFHYDTGMVGKQELQLWLDSTYSDLNFVFYKPNDGAADTINISHHLDYAMLALLLSMTELEVRAPSFRVVWYTSDGSYHMEYNPSDLSPTDPLVDSTLALLRKAEAHAIYAVLHAEVDKREQIRIIRDQVISIRREVEIYSHL